MMEDRRESAPQIGESRRDVMKKMAYAAPLVLSLAASPAFASSGSGASTHHGDTDANSNGRRKSINN